MKLFLNLIFICFLTKPALSSNQNPLSSSIKAGALQNQKETDCSQNLTLDSKEYYIFSLERLMPSLFGININLQSPSLRRWMKKTVDIVEKHTGITPETTKQTDLFFTDHTEEVFFKALLEKVIPILTFNKKRLSPKFTALDLGVVLDQQKLGCLELSLFTSIVLAEYGISNVLVFSGYHYPEHADMPYFPPCLSIKYLWGRNNLVGIGFLNFDQDQTKPLLSSSQDYRHLSHKQYMIVQPKDF